MPSTSVATEIKLQNGIVVLMNGGKKLKGVLIMEQKLTPEQFVLKAIRDLRDLEKGYKGIHVVYSGFNVAFEKYFGFKARETVDAMIAKGMIESKFAKGGVMIYLKGEMPVSNQASDVLKKMGL